MTEYGKPERHSQNRIIKFFHDELGYKYLGNWEDRVNNSNIEEALLTSFLHKQGYSNESIKRAIYELQTTANNHNNGLYTNNKNTYQQIRYGINVKTEAGKNYENVAVVDWKNPLNNDFGIAEEVTVLGNHEKRPDIGFFIKVSG